MGVNSDISVIEGRIRTQVEYGNLELMARPSDVLSNHSKLKSELTGRVATDWSIHIGSSRARYRTRITSSRFKSKATTCWAALGCLGFATALGLLNISASLAVSASLSRWPFSTFLPHWVVSAALPRWPFSTFLPHRAVSAALRRWDFVGRAGLFSELKRTLPRPSRLLHPYQ